MLTFLVSTNMVLNISFFAANFWGTDLVSTFEKICQCFKARNNMSIFILFIADWSRNNLNIDFLLLKINFNIFSKLQKDG